MKCPICSNFIPETDLINTEYFNTKYYDTVEGTCSNCKKLWRWTEVFVFDHCMDIQEVKEE